MEEEEIDILLALLRVPDCREEAGLPPCGGLSQQQIANYTGMSLTQVRRAEQDAMMAIYLYLHHHPELEQELKTILENL